MDAETRLAAAGLRLTLDRPYLATALWAVQRVGRPGIGTLAVDRRWRLYFDPETVAGWSVDELSAVLYHELCHLLRAHADRAFVADSPLLWNLATDAEINDDLRAEGAPLPGAPVCPATLGMPDGLLAEEYLARLRTTDAAVPAERGLAAGRCGSAASGYLEPWEEDHAGESAPAGVTDGEAEVIRHRVALAIEEHARGRGTVPGHWARWATPRLEPRVDWRRELGALVRRAVADAAGAVDYSYRRPSRRQASCRGVVLPSLRQPVPRVAVVVDTSGSVSSDLLEQAVAEVGGILRAAGQPHGTPVLAVDAAVQSCRRVFRAEQVRLAGGGGTDMGVGLAAVDRLRPRPDLAIVITDGHTPWPERRPLGVRVVVALTDDAGRAPPWARAVTVR